jgi:site-specific DNA-methyltransferase (adenine-specific)
MLELNRIYCGDCLDLMQEMPDKSVDLVLTDPPYGIGEKWKGGFNEKHGWGKAKEECELRNTWDDLPPTKEYFIELFRISQNQIIFGGNYFELPPSRCWLVWTKPERDFSLAEAELAWTSFDNVIRIFDGNRSDPNRVHPTQKPLKLMEWCLEKYSKLGMTVLDPFMGSGTTCVACKKLGRNFIGIEKEPAYVAIAEKRLEKVNNHKITDFFGVLE